MTDPTPNMFKYDRRYPPMFFCAPSSQEAGSWHRSMTKQSRCYSNHNTKDPGLVLANGCTIGEYSMWLLTNNHRKRRMNKKVL